jgi:uncharacterized phage infection (PIP) family protein YhgE
MGAWSHESFGNDDACDWAYDLEEADDLSLIESALDAVLAAGSEYLEAPEASQAIAAAEAVARLQGNFGIKDSYSETVDTWVGKVKLVPTSQLVAKTRQVLDRIIAEPSELLELWQESDESDSWLGAVSELRARIRD